MSREVQVRFCESRGVRFPPATHLLALCRTRQQAEQVQARLAGWLAPRGLAFNQDKTRITHLDQGVDFLGVRDPPVRRQAADQAEQRCAAADPEAIVRRVLGQAPRAHPAPGQPGDLAPAAPPARPVPAMPGLLLYAGHEPRDERGWEQWHTAIRKANRKHAITTVMDLGTPDEQAAHHLIHAHCRRRIGGSSPALLPGPKPSGLA